MFASWCFYLGNDDPTVEDFLNSDAWGYLGLLKVHGIDSVWESETTGVDMGIFCFYLQHVLVSVSFVDYGLLWDVASYARV